MDLRFTEEQEMLKTSAKDFLVAECPKSKVRELEEDKIGHSPELWKKMAELGWMGLIIPEQYQGMGMTFQDGMALIEEVGRNLLPEPFISTLVASFAILAAGSESQKQEFLPKISRGEIKVSLAYLEENGKYDVSGITIKAAPRGEDFILNGTKMFVEMAHIADYLVCAARTGDSAKPEDGITLFIIDAKSPGITTEIIPTIASDKLCEVKFDNVQIPKNNVLGEVNKGYQALKDALRKAAIVKSVESVGSMQACIDMTVAYMKERVQYGRPIGAFQALQHLIADAWIATQTARYLVYEAVWKESSGLPCDKEASMAKAYTNEAYKFVSKWGIRLHGGIGTSREHDMSLYYRRAKAADCAYGGTDFHNEIVARELGFQK
ncbi:MAG: acyl-CoA/acyl-ACP dehydrogenase [Dehalococcoidales bacterium]|nr:acyl-CoA/acyl-ACP dehydrogenase [Dehalococcoidales bacterium]